MTSWSVSAAFSVSISLSSDYIYVILFKKDWREALKITGLFKTSGKKKKTKHICNEFLTKGEFKKATFIFAFFKTETKSRSIKLFSFIWSYYRRNPWRKLAKLQIWIFFIPALSVEWTYSLLVEKHENSSYLEMLFSESDPQMIASRFYVEYGSRISVSKGFFCGWEWICWNCSFYFVGCIIIRIKQFRLVGPLWARSVTFRVLDSNVPE